MESEVWTIFHRSGRYTKDYEPLWERYLCYGATVERTMAADSLGNRKNGLKLCLPAHSVRLLDEVGQSVTFGEAAIGPGDLLFVGEVLVPGRNGYRIGSVTETVGVGFADGYTLVAE